MEEYMFEKEFSNSFGINSFVAWSENYPLQKAMVDHNQERVETVRGGCYAVCVIRSLAAHTQV